MNATMFLMMVFIKEEKIVFSDARTENGDEMLGRCASEKHI